MFPAKIPATTPSTLPTFSLGHGKKITLEAERGLDIVQRLAMKGIKSVYTQAPASPKQTCPQIDLAPSTVRSI